MGFNPVSRKLAEVLGAVYAAGMPLSGIRVLDLTDVAGALGARLLADLGADVVRVEPPGGRRLRRIDGNDRRVELGGRGAVESFYSWGTRSVVLDPGREADRLALDRLAGAADLILDGRPADELPALATLREATQPVTVRITPFGDGGPRSGWLGSDLVCAARGGMIGINGHPGAPPLQPFGLQAYNSTGVFAAIAGLIGLYARRPGERGEAFDLSCQAAVAGAVEHLTGLLRQNGATPVRQGTLHWSRTFRVGPCADGHVLHSILGDWTTLVEWVAADGDDRGLRNPRYEAPDVRRDESEDLFDQLDLWSAEHPLEELAEGGLLRRLPCAPVRPISTLADDPQLRARGGYIRLDDAEGPFPGPPFLLSRTPWKIRRPAPGLDDHAAEVRTDPAWSSERSESTGTRQASATHSSASPRVDTERTPAGSRTVPDRPLAGLRVLDFTWVVSGPVATRTLADQGAEIIKIEHRESPDFGTRRGGLMGNLHRGKNSVVLDMHDPRAVDMARKLVAVSDVVIDNFSARVLPNWGLDDDSLRGLRPDGIFVHMSGFGHTGPWCDQVSYGPTLQALTGLPLVMRHPDGLPAGWGYSYSDMAAGMMAALAILAALQHRLRTGEGQVVDLGQYENLVALLGPPVLDALSGRAIDPIGNASAEGACSPHGVYPCREDRWIAIAVLEDVQWMALAAVLRDDGQDWAAEPELKSASTRWERREELGAAIARWTPEFEASELEARLQGVGIPAGLVADGHDLEADPQLRSRGYFVDLVTREGPWERFDGIPFVARDRPGALEAPGPLRGEHTDDVLKRVLGMSAAEIDPLRAEGVIG